MIKTEKRFKVQDVPEYGKVARTWKRCKTKEEAEKIAQRWTKQSKGSGVKYVVACDDPAENPRRILTRRIYRALIFMFPLKTWKMREVKEWLEEHGYKYEHKKFYKLESATLRYYLYNVKPATKGRETDTKTMMSDGKSLKVIVEK